MTSGWPAGGGEMGERIRALDWSASPLEPLDTWPRSLRTAVDLMLAAAQPVCIGWGSDLFSLFNDAYVPFLGDKHPGGLGKPFAELWPEIAEKSRPLIDAIFAGDAQYFVDQPIALQGRPGRPVSWVTYSWTPLRDDSGAIAGFYCVADETTERVLAERARREQEAAALKAADAERAAAQCRAERSDALLVQERRVMERVAEGAPLAVTLAELTRGFEARFAERKPRVSVLLLDDEGARLRHGAAPSLPDAYNRVIDGVAVGEGMGSCGTAAFRGTRVTVTDIATDPLWWDFASVALGHGLRACWSTPILDPQGQVLGTFAIYYDAPAAPTPEEMEAVSFFNRVAAIAIERHRIDEVLRRSEEKYRKLYEELREASRTKDEFLAMLGHELRNPLAPIMSHLQLMRLREPDTLVRDREIIESQVRHMVGLVDDLLDVSRIARGKVELKVAPIDMADVVTKAIETVSPLLEENAQIIEKKVDDGLTVQGDPRRLVQVVTNLLSNAIKYSPPRGPIAVSASAEGGEFVLRVRDQGIGIDPDLMPHIFDLFAQSAQSIERAEGGLGLGLAIVQNLVTLHDGHVEAVSEGRGCGSEFVVRLPLLERPQVVQAMPTAAAPAGETAANDSKVKVLVVDDYVDAAVGLAELLELDGYETRIAFDGAAALQIAAEFKPAVALIDIGLPGMNGYEVARRLRETPDLETTALIAVTGYGQDSDRRAAEEAGFDEHVVKPLDPAAIGALVERFTSTRDAFAPHEIRARRGL